MSPSFLPSSTLPHPHPDPHPHRPPTDCCWVFSFREESRPFQTEPGIWHKPSGASSWAPENEKAALGNLNRVLSTRASANQNPGSPRVRVHGQGGGATGAAASTPRPDPARPHPRSRAGYPGARVLPLPPRPSRAQSGKGRCWGPLFALASFPFLFPGVDKLLQS